LGASDEILQKFVLLLSVNITTLCNTYGRIQ